MTLIQQLRQVAKKYAAAQVRHEKEAAKYYVARDAENKTWRQMEDVVTDLVASEILAQGVWLPCDSNGTILSRSKERLRSGDFAHYRRTVSKVADFIQIFEDANYHKNNINIRIELPEPPCGGVSVDFRVEYDKMSETFIYRININVWGGAKVAPTIKYLGMFVGSTNTLDRRLHRLRQLRAKVNDAIKVTAKRFKLVEATAASFSKRGKKKSKKKK